MALRRDFGLTQLQRIVGRLSGTRRRADVGTAVAKLDAEADGNGSNNDEVRVPVTTRP